MTVEKPHDTGLPPGITIDDYGQIKRQDTYRDLESEVLGVQAASLAKSLETIGGYIEANLECGQFHNVARAITLAATVTEAANHAWENSSIAQPIDKTQGFWPDADILPGFDEGQWRRVEYLPESSAPVVQKVVQPEVIPSEELRESVEIPGEPTPQPTGQIYQAHSKEEEEAPPLVSLQVSPQPDKQVTKKEDSLEEKERRVREACPAAGVLMDSGEFWEEGWGEELVTQRNNIARLLFPREGERKDSNAQQFFSQVLLPRYMIRRGGERERFGQQNRNSGRTLYVSKSELIDFLAFASAELKLTRYSFADTTDVEFLKSGDAKKTKGHVDRVVPEPDDGRAVDSVIPVLVTKPTGQTAEGPFATVVDARSRVPVDSGEELTGEQKEEFVRTICPAAGVLLDDEKLWTGENVVRNNIALLLRLKNPEQETKLENAMMFLNSQLVEWFKHSSRHREKFGKRIHGYGHHYFITREQLVDFIIFADKHMSDKDGCRYELNSDEVRPDFIKPEYKKKQKRAGNGRARLRS